VVEIINSLVSGDESGGILAGRGCAWDVLEQHRCMHSKLIVLVVILLTILIYILTLSIYLQREYK